MKDEQFRTKKELVGAITQYGLRTDEKIKLALIVIAEVLIDIRDLQIKKQED